MIKKAYPIDLKELKNMTGFSKKQVIDVLGQDCNDMHEQVWTYKIGCLGVFWLKRYVLFFFDKKNRVKNIKIKIRL